MLSSSRRGLIAASAATLLALTGCGAASDGEARANAATETSATSPTTEAKAPEPATPKEIAREFSERAFSLEVRTAPDIESATTIMGDLLTPTLRQDLINATNSGSEEDYLKAWQMLPYHWDGVFDQTGMPTQTTTSNMTTKVLGTFNDGDLSVEVMFDFTWSYEGREDFTAKGAHALRMEPGIDPDGPAWQVSNGEGVQARNTITTLPFDPSSPDRMSAAG
ncbi:hypothetical protein O2W18_02880 [Modestobacter sp. VKM Ac-2983]|uniref:hypothetical protein n=1 Tax=Modestobacter sp. VKM Ac-2983 TaxID=3004137 RepID=UPI0022ABAF63|nr:hypothetical protein [Modestobacter sp. VKM Ac-2983]MCZ2804041.1 hypothetical protein [Modestobacter sp. VKM Ac-2983]